MPSLRLSLILMTTTFAVQSVASAATFQGLGGDFADDVSGDGSTVVGHDGQQTQNTIAWRWTAAGGKVLLPRLHADTFGALPWGVSHDGSVVAGHSDSTSGGRFAVVWTSGGARNLGAGRAWGGVSADGTVIAGDVSYDNNGGPVDATRWTLRPDGTVARQRLSFTTSSANGISADGRVVVGISGGSVRWVAESGTLEHLGLPPGATSGSANAASADGSVIVGAVSDAASVEAFRWSVGSGMVGLGDLPGGAMSSVANDLTADGSVVVGNGMTDEGRRAFIWDESNGIRNLADVMQLDWGLDLDGWIIDRVSGISDDGLVMTGSGFNPAGSREAWVVVVPEPSSAVLAIFLAGLPLLRRARS